MSGVRTGSKRARRERPAWPILALLLTALACALIALYRLRLSAIAAREVALLSAYGAPDAEVIAICTLESTVAEAAQSPEALAARQWAAQSDAAARRVLALSAENPDCIGWLTLPAAEIDAPLMHTPDRRDYYINRNFDGKKSRSGLPFLDERCQRDGLHRIVYGHNMKDGSMFGSLKALLSAPADEPMELFYDDETGRARYTVIAVFLTEVDESAPFRFYAYADLSDPRDYADYLAGVSALCGRPVSVPTEHARLITLVTCSDHAPEGRLVAVAAEAGG